ncbi:MAG: hypothetical protein ACREXP_00540 [Steroidobacteraceae bacterium]
MKATYGPIIPVINDLLEGNHLADRPLRSIELTSWEELQSYYMELRGYSKGFELPSSLTAFRKLERYTHHSPLGHQLEVSWPRFT